MIAYKSNYTWNRAELCLFKIVVNPRLFIQCSHSLIIRLLGTATKSNCGDRAKWWLPGLEVNTAAVEAEKAGQEEERQWPHCGFMMWRKGCRRNAGRAEVAEGAGSNVVMLGKAGWKDAHLGICSGGGTSDEVCLAQLGATTMPCYGPEADSPDH